MGPSLSQRRALISFVALVARATSAADSNGAWLYPDPSIVPTFNYLDTLNASWTSDFSTPWLHLWCGITNADSSSPALGELYNKTAPATGSLLFPLNYALEPFSCHFEVSRQPEIHRGPPFAMSGTFNVAIESTAKPVIWSQNMGNPSTASTGMNASTDTEIRASPTPSTITLTSTSASRSTITSAYTSTSTPGPQASGSSGLSQGAKIGIGNTSTGSTATNASADPELTASPTPSASTSTSTSTPGPQASGSSGLSQGAKIGIGVGVVVGVLALIATNVATLFWLRRRKPNAKTMTTIPPTDTYRYQLPVEQRRTFFAPNKMLRSEMAADPQVHEKDGAPVATTMHTICELGAP